jgi:hypothetical protein
MRQGLVGIEGKLAAFAVMNHGRSLSQIARQSIGGGWAGFQFAGNPQEAPMEACGALWLLATSDFEAIQ